MRDGAIVLLGYFNTFRLWDRTCSFVYLKLLKHFLNSWHSDIYIIHTCMRGIWWEEVLGDSGFFSKDGLKLAIQDVCLFFRVGA